MKFVAAGLAVLLFGAAVGAQVEYVIVRPGGKEYHKPGCELIRDAKNVVAMKRAEAENRGLKPHAACASSKIDTSPQPPPKPVFVFVDDGRYYHREKCAKLGKDPKRVQLDAAAKKYWPCPTCKPPIRPRQGAKGAEGAKWSSSAPSHISD